MGLHPTTLRAAHFILDSARADRLRQQWVDANTGIPLELADCPDRRLAHAAARMVSSRASSPAPGSGCTAPLASAPTAARR
jgi:hypothetical protein